MFVSAASLSSEKTHRSAPYCAASNGTHFQPTCGNADEVIAVESIQHGTKLTTTCGLFDKSAKCCSYDSGDCLFPYTANPLQSECSGKQVCSGSNPSGVDSSSCGPGYPSVSHYYTMEYYCLPGNYSEKPEDQWSC